MKPHSGMFQKGNTMSRGRAKNKLTKELMQFVEDKQLTIKAGEYLLDVLLSDDTSNKEKLDATKFIISQFTISADKQTDVELAEDTLSSDDVLKLLLEKTKA